MPLSVLARCAPLRPPAPLPRRGMAGWALGTVAFFAVAAVLPRGWADTAGTLLPMFVVVGAAVSGASRRQLERWLTAPYVLLVLAAVALDVALLAPGSVPAVLVGLLPAGGGLLSWSRPRIGRAGAARELR